MIFSPVHQSSPVIVDYHFASTVSQQTSCVMLSDSGCRLPMGKIFAPQISVNVVSAKRVHTDFRYAGAAGGLQLSVKSSEY